MPIKSSLQMLLDHAQKQSDNAAKKLGQLTSHQQQQEQKLQLLLEYRHSYQERLQESAKNGIDQTGWSNFTAFMNKLDAAIIEQRKNITTASDNREIGRSEFTSRQSKLKSYDTLAKRQRKIEMQQQTKHEQKEQDEYAATTSSRNQFTAKN